MPFVSVRTSAASTSSTGSFLGESEVHVESEVLVEFSRAVAEALAKPEAYVMVELERGLAMSFAGSADPCCYVEVRGIGAATPSQKAAAATALTAVCERTLGVTPKRVFVVFQAVPAADWAMGGTLFG